MVVRVEDARIEVEIDVRRAVDETREIESTLERARARRRLGQARIDPGREGRLGMRRLGAAAVGAGVGRAAATGIRRAVGLAAKVGFGLTLTEIIRQTPAILPALLGEETLRTQLIPELDIIPEITLPQRLPSPMLDTLIFDVFGLERFRGQKIFQGSEIEGVTVEDLVKGLQEKVAQIEGTLKTTVQAATLAYDLLMEGKIAEAGIEAIQEIQRIIQPSPKPRSLDADSKDAPAGLGVVEEAGQILDAFRAYNTAETLFRIRAGHLRYEQFFENWQRGVRAGGGGVSQ